MALGLPMLFAGWKGLAEAVFKPRGPAGVQLTYRYNGQGRVR